MLPASFVYDMWVACSPDAQCPLSHYNPKPLIQVIMQTRDVVVRFWARRRVPWAMLANCNLQVRWRWWWWWLRWWWFVVVEVEVVVVAVVVYTWSWN